MGGPKRSEFGDRCAPECDSEEAAPRATKAERPEDVSDKACPEGTCVNFRCAPECDNEEAAPRALKIGRPEDDNRVACPEGVL